MFDLRRVMRTQYRIDDYQQNYFVLSGFDELLRVTLETDFAPLYAELDSLPDIDIAQLVEGDEFVSRDTQEYPAAKAAPACCSGGRSLPSLSLFFGPLPFWRQNSAIVRSCETRVGN